MTVNLIRQLNLVALLTGIGVAGAMAQTNLDNAAGSNTEGQSLQPEKLTATDVSESSNLRPSRPERTDLPPEVRARLDHFKKDARAYLAKRDALKKELVGANDKERAAIRRQVEALRREWMQRAREMRKEFRERQVELINKLPDYREVIDSARNAALQEAQQAQSDTTGRTRRGED